MIRQLAKREEAATELVASVGDAALPPTRLYPLHSPLPAFGEGQGWGDCHWSSI